MSENFVAPVYPQGRRGRGGFQGARARHVVQKRTRERGAGPPRCPAVGVAPAAMREGYPPARAASAARGRRREAPPGTRPGARGNEDG